MDDLKNLAGPVETELLVAFSDLTLFSRTVQTMSERDLFETMADYFAFVGDHVGASGGILVKCIGDAALIVFPKERVEAGVKALVSLKAEGDRRLADQGLPCRHVIKAHFGPVTCGQVGARGDERFDLYGKTVNTAAMLRSPGLAITDAVYAQLGAETREIFEKHAPPAMWVSSA
jgi:adenylate cyclase